MPKVMASAPNAGGRHQRGRRVSGTLAEINVIPLVDVMLVLLIIFMVAAPMLQQGIEMKLPTAGKSSPLSSERIFVDVPLTFRDDFRVFLNKEPVGLQALGERIRQLMLNRSDKSVILRMDGELTVQHQIRITEQLRAGGAEQMGVATDPITGRQ
jgi:biopolymer transport protein TolR